MRDLLIATRNTGKVREFASLLASVPLRCVSLADVGLGYMDVEETGDTFEANAALKARAYADVSGLLTLADDSGIAVDALNGAPGIYSARYGGPGMTDQNRYQKLLEALAYVPDEARTARFVCVLALAEPGTAVIQYTRGVCEGHIARAPQGANGFGYDPVFIANGYTVSTAELTPEEKDRISHRGRAAAEMIPVLQKYA